MKKLLLFFACTIFLAAGALAQATYHVDATSGSDDNNGTEWSSAWKTIQHAINEVAAGDEILVAPGDYPERLTIGKSITITGEVDGESRPVVRPTFGKPDIELFEVISIRPSSVKENGFIRVGISGLNIDGRYAEKVYAGVYADNAIVNLENLIIHSIGNTAEEANRWVDNTYGVYISEGKLSVKESWIYNIQSVQLDSEKAVSLKKINNRAVGIYANELQGLSVTDTKIHDITCEFGDASGISVHKQWDYTKTDILPDFEISGNAIHGVRAHDYAAGIYSNEATSLQIHGNTIEDVGGGDKAFGIVLDYAPINNKTNKGEEIGNTEKAPSNTEILGNRVSRIFHIVPEVNGLFKAAEKLEMDPFTSFGIYADIPGKLFIHGNSITTAPLPAGKGFVASGPGTGIYFLADDAHILDNEIAHCMFGVYTVFAPNLLVEDNTFEESQIGVFLLDFAFSKQMPDQYDFPFELPEPPEMAKNEFSIGSLAFVGNTFTGTGDNSSPHAGIVAILGGPLKGGIKGLPTPRFIAHGNLIENFMDGIVLAISDYNAAEISGKNIIQNNGNGVYISPLYSKIDPPVKGESLSPLVFINHNTIQDNQVGVFNGSGVVRLNDPDKTEVLVRPVDAKFNYWGTEDGPGFVGRPKGIVLENGVSEGVWYSPWLGFHPGTPPGDMTYYVDDTGSIQDAIDLASPGDIIRILSGYYEGDIVVGQGDGLTLYPGDSPACVAILGNLTVASGNTLFIEMDGTTPACGEGIIAKNGSGEYTQVYVFGEVDLGGIALDLNLGFVPKIGNQFEIIVSDYPITGKFSQEESITVEYEGRFYTFDILYNPNGNASKENGYMVVLELQQIDEPIAVPLSGWAIALGMLLMAGFVAFRFRM